MAYLGIDYGEKNIGVAVGDEAGLIASPTAVVSMQKHGEHFSELAALAEKWRAKYLVFGLPLNAEGQETEKCAEVRKFAAELKRTIPNSDDIELKFYPEYYSTQFANQGRTRKQKQEKGDSYAAAHILQAFLDWQRQGY